MLSAIDMLNHSSLPERRCTELRLVTEPLTVRVRGCGGWRLGPLVTRTHTPLAPSPSPAWRTAQCGEPPREVTLSSYFALNAERDIAAGEQVLLTYGELSGEVVPFQ